MTDPKEAKRLHENRLGAIRKRRFHENRKKSGMVRLTDLWTYPKFVERIKNLVAKLNRGE